MGGKSSTAGGNFQNLPKFQYLDRRNGSIVTFINSKPGISKLPDDLTLNRNSAVTNSDEVFFILGGESESRELQQDFISIDSSSIEIKILKNVPIPTKLGYLFCHKRSLIYSGGISKDPVTGKKIQSPIMKYSILKDKWEIYNHTNLIIPNSNKCRFKDLRKPGYLLIEDKLIMFGGYFRTSSRRVANVSIVSFDVKSENFSFNAESFQFPVEIYSPVTNSSKHRGLVVGGKGLNSVDNEFIFKFSSSKFRKVKSHTLKVTEYYPPTVHQNFDIIFSFPNVSVRELNSTNWKTLNFEAHVQKFISMKISSSEKVIKSWKSSSIGRLTQRSELSDLQSPRSQQFFPNENFEKLESLNLDYILNTETDQEVTVSHKAALKLLVFISDKVEKKKLFAINVNEISAQMNFQPEVSVAQILLIFECILLKDEYFLSDAIVVYKSIHKILNCHIVRSLVLTKILSNVGIVKPTSSLSKDKIVFVLGRLIKAGVVGVEI